MKAKELKELLVHIPDDYEIILSSDSEGNSFSPLSSCSVQEYVAENTYSGEILEVEEDSIDCLFEEDEEEEIEDEHPNAVSCIVLWPTN